MQNAFKYMDQLKQKGYTHEQAEGFVSVMFESMNDNLATKSDLEKLSLKMDNRFLELSHKISEVNSTLDNRITETNSKLILKMGSMMTILAGLVVSLLAIILK